MQIALAANANTCSGMNQVLVEDTSGDDSRGNVGTVHVTPRF